MYKRQASISPNLGLQVNVDTTILGNLYVSKSIIADQLIVNLISSSVIYSSGSNIFGNDTTHIQQLTGSVQIQTELIAGFVTASSYTGSFTGAFNGYFSGDGSQLTNVPATVAPRIASGSATASISPNLGLQINTGVSVEEFLVVTGSAEFKTTVSALSLIHI